MRPALRKSRPRHLAGVERTPWEPEELAADFDVAAALDAGADYDFQALFAADDEPFDYDEILEPPRQRVRVARSKVAFAVSITIAAVPFLVLDNFPATAESPSGGHVQAAAGAVKQELRSVVTLPEGIPTSEVPVTVDVTIGKATLYVGQPTTTTTAAPVQKAVAPTTTEKPDPVTTTTVKSTTTTVKSPTTTVAPAAAVAPTPPDPNDPATWDKLAKCESGGNWQAVSQPRNGMQYYGGLQFSKVTWEDLGGTGLPSDAPKETQIEMGKKLQARQGWDAWPTCARQLGWI